jgi:hypothetical protein
MVKAVKNQTGNYSTLHDQNLGLGVGSFDPVSGWQFNVSLIRDFLLNFIYYGEILNRTNNTIDFNGASRVCWQILLRAGLIDSLRDS